jgi:hypothetical protein
MDDSYASHSLIMQRFFLSSRRGGCPKIEVVSPKQTSCSFVNSRRLKELVRGIRTS